MSGYGDVYGPPDAVAEYPEPCDCCRECPECTCHLVDYERVALKEELGDACPF